MTVEDGIALVEQVLSDGRLTKVQELVFRQAWQGMSYSDMAKLSVYDAGYIKDTGSKLWQTLSQAFGEKVTKQNFRGVLQRTKRGNGKATSTPHSSLPDSAWGEVIDASIFHGHKLELTCQHNLPTREGEFLVRDRELQQLLEMLSFESPIACISVEGIGGMGKTALALAAAYQCLKTCAFEAIVFTSAKPQRLTPHGILSRLKPDRSLPDLFRAIAHTLNRSNILLAEFQEQLEQIHAGLAQQPTLLIVDNLETVEDYEAVLAFLYDLPALVKVVITSRRQTPFATLRLNPLSEFESLRLIQRQAVLKQLSLRSTDAQRLHQRTSGIPAAIVYAVGQLAAGYPLKDVPNRLALATGEYARFYFEGSIMPLRGELSHQLLMALALFPRSALPDALAYVADSPDLASAIEGLARLQQRSLVYLLEDRYDMLALTREYAIAELRNHPNFEQAARERWVNWYLDFAQQHGGKDWKEWNEYGPLEQEWENLQAAIEWCIASDRYEDVRQFWQRVNGYTHVQGHRSNRISCWATRLDWTEWLIQAAESRQDWATVLEVMDDQGWTLILLGQSHHLERADALYQRAWRLRHHKDSLFQSQLAIHVAVLRIQQQQFADAIDWLRKAEQLLDRTTPTEHPRSRLHVSYYQGEIAYKTGDYPQARSCFQHVLAQAEALNWQRAVFLAKDWLANIAIQQEHYNEAQGLLQEGLLMAELNRDECRAAFCKRSISRLEKARGKEAVAVHWASEAMCSFQQLGMMQEATETAVLLQSLGANTSS